jgi:TatD DNase family protein
MHCFTESWSVAEAAMEQGFYISFSGIVTFKNALELKAVARRVPMERLLVETDAPYLAPVPYRGKRNEPAYVRYVAEHLSEIKTSTLQIITLNTSSNFSEVFKIPL